MKLPALVTLLALCSSSSALAAPPAVDSGLVRIALVIGNNQPPANSGVPTLRYADDDALALHQLLLEAGIESSLLVSEDAETREQAPGIAHRPATRAELARLTTQLQARVRAARAAGKRSELLFFYSGHGDVDEENSGYVMLDDGRLTRAGLHALLTQVGADRNHVIVDACKSYFFAFERGPGGTRTPYTGAPLARAVPAELANTGFVLSTSHSGVSHEWEHYRAGVVSYEIRSALRGAADVDHDGVISYAELGAFVARANERLAPNVRPDVLVRAPQGAAPTALLAWSHAASVELGPAQWGHVYLENARAERLADIHPSQQDSTFLWVPEERPLFVRRHDESAELVVESAAQARLDPADARRPDRTEKGAVGMAFEAQLFSLPFGAADVQRFLAQPAVLAPAQVALHDSGMGAARRNLVWVSVGSAVLFAVTGGVLRAVAQGHYDDSAAFAKACGSQLECQPSSIRDKQGGGRTLETLSWVSWGLAGAASATALTLLLLPEHTQVSLGAGSVQLRQRF